MSERLTQNGAKIRLVSSYGLYNYLYYRNVSEQTISDLCAQADDKLLDKIIGNNRHLLYPLYSLQYAVSTTPSGSGLMTF